MQTFSTIDFEFVKEYLHIDWTEDDVQLGVFLEVAREFILNLADTQDPTDLDGKRISIILLLKVVSDFYANRSTSTDVAVDPLYAEMVKQIRTYNLGNGDPVVNLL